MHYLLQEFINAILSAMFLFSIFGIAILLAKVLKIK